MERSAMETEVPVRPGVEVDPEVLQLVRQRRADKSDGVEEASQAMADIRKTFKALVPQ